MNLESVSPKAIAAFLVPFLAALILYLVTGDDTYLVALLLATAGGGAAVVAKPAPGVTMKDIRAVKALRRPRGSTGP